MALRVALALAAALIPAAAWAQQPAAPAQRIGVELNRLEDSDGGCRIYMVFSNPSADALSSLKLELISFDPAGVINRRLLVEGGPLSADKTVVKLFAMSDVACGEIDRILLNDVPSCEGGGGPLPDCLSRLDISSRADAAFVK